MIGITLTADQIRNAPREVRQWIEHEVMAGLGIAAAQPPAPPPQAAHLVACSVEEAQAILTRIEGVLPAINVFFELGRPVVSYGQPPVMVFSPARHHASHAPAERRAGDGLPATDQPGAGGRAPRCLGSVLRFRRRRPLPAPAADAAKHRHALADDGRRPSGGR
jgi:hypothetical protein